MADYQSVIPAQDRPIHIFTFQDVVDKLLDLFDLKRSDPRNLRLAKEATLSAYRDICQRRRWSYYERRGSLVSDAPFETGTLTYDATGGTYERMVTFTDALPDWARWGRIYLDNGFYDIERVISSTVVTLKQHNAPNEDMAAGTDFKLYRFAYNLPNEFRTMVQMFDVTNKRWRPINFISHRYLQREQTLGYITPDTPWEACIRGDPDRYGGSILEFSTSSSIARTYDFLYIALPRPLALEYASSGTVTTSGTTVTLTGASFPEDCLGSIIRFSSSTRVEPTGVAGNTLGVDNRYTAARVIKERTSDSAVVLDEALTADVDAVRYVISDPIDIDYNVMLNAFHAMARAEFCLASRVEDETFRRYAALANQELIKAMEADVRADTPGAGILHNRNRALVDNSANQTM